MATRRKGSFKRRSRPRRTYRQRGGATAAAPNGATAATTPPTTTNASPLFRDAYTITMPEFPERWEHMKAQAAAAQIPLQSFPGVKITPEQRDTLPPLGVGTTHYKDRTGATFNLGVIGAYLAHRNLLEHIAKTAPDHPGTLIFEDDVSIPPDFYSKLASIAPEIPADWDYIFLEKFRTEGGGKMISPHIMKLDKDMTAMKNWGFRAFIVKNASIASKILPTMEHMLDVPDIQLNKFADRINMYLVQPIIVRADTHIGGNSAVSILDVQKPSSQ